MLYKRLSFPYCSVIFNVFFLLAFFCSLLSFYAQAQREIILNTTGYGFDRTAENGINSTQWAYIQKFANLKYQDQDAKVTAVRLHIQWNQYEPTLGNYQREKIVLAVKAIIALNMKVALHFPYQRGGTMNDNYTNSSDVAQIYDGNLVQDGITYSCPSIYSRYSTERFHAFVDDVLNQLRDFYPQILYVEMGNTTTEEFYIPAITRDGMSYPGIYDSSAKDRWHNTFLRIRFPNQNVIRWGENQYERANAPLPTDGNWNSEIGRDFHRFAAWGLVQQLKGFNDVVKSHSPSLKVLHFISDFGSAQGNIRHLHNSTIPLALNLTDGIYTTDGTNRDDLWRKILSLDCIKGTNPDKIAAIEFDPEDLQRTPRQHGLDEGMAIEWIERAFKHGANYVHIAMTFSDEEIQQLANAIATCKAKYLNPGYQPPSRSGAITENIYPNVFTGNFLFESWKSNRGDNWTESDINPKSIRMEDNGYWLNIWDPASSLPVTLIDFNALKEEESVQLTWSTSSESNSENFEIERSTEGKIWKKIGVVNASGESGEIVSYSFIDNAPANGENLYRLKSVDFDKTYAYSRIISMMFETESFFTIYPNPASEKLSIESEDWEQVGTIEILNPSGQMLYHSSSDLQREINIENFSAGVYFVCLTHKDGKRELNKFVKEED